MADADLRALTRAAALDPEARARLAVMRRRADVSWNLVTRITGTRRWPNKTSHGFDGDPEPVHGSPGAARVRSWCGVVIVAHSEKAISLDAQHDPRCLACRGTRRWRELRRRRV